MKYALTAINIRVCYRLPGEWLPGVSARCPCRQSPALRPGRRRRHQRQYPLVRHWARATPCAVDSSTMPGCTSWLRPALMLSGTKPVRWAAQQRARQAGHQVALKHLGLQRRALRGHPDGGRGQWRGSGCHGAGHSVQRQMAWQVHAVMQDAQDVDLVLVTVDPENNQMPPSASLSGHMQGVNIFGHVTARFATDDRGASA